jgi:hypothetical protein
MNLSKEEILFLKTLDNFEGDHTSNESLKIILLEHGIDEEQFDAIKRRLLFNGYIGSVYGNVTLQKKNYELD